MLALEEDALQTSWESGLNTRQCELILCMDIWDRNLYDSDVCREAEKACLQRARHKIECTEQRGKQQRPWITEHFQLPVPYKPDLDNSPINSKREEIVSSMYFPQGATTPAPFAEPCPPLPVHVVQLRLTPLLPAKSSGGHVSQAQPVSSFRTCPCQSLVQRAGI